MIFVNKKIIFFSVIFFSIIFNLKSDSDISYYNRGVQYFNARDFHNAIRYFENAYNINPESEIYEEALISAYNSHSLRLIRENKYIQSLYFLTKAHQISHFNETIINNLSVVYSRLGNQSFRHGNYSEAIEYYIKALEYSDDYIIYNNISASYQNMSVVEDNVFNKIILLNKSIDYNLNNYSAKYNLANLFYQQKMYDEAINNFKSVYENSDELKAQSALYLGIIYEEIFDFNNARKFLKESLKLGLPSEELISRAKRVLMFIEPREYLFSQKFTIENKSSHDLHEVSIVINVPHSINSVQKTSLLQETTTFKHTKNRFTDEYNNNYIEYQTDTIKGNSISTIELLYSIKVEPIVKNVNLLKNLPLPKNINQRLFNYIDRNINNKYELIRKIYDFVINNIEYEIIGGDYTVTEILRYNKGKCVEYTTLFNYLIELAGLPVRAVLGEVYQIDPDPYLEEAGHSWSEVYINGLGWFKFDHTFEDTGKKNFFGNVRTDRFVIAYEKSHGISIDYSVKHIVGSRRPQTNLILEKHKDITLSEKTFSLF